MLRKLDKKGNQNLSLVIDFKWNFNDNANSNHS